MSVALLLAAAAALPTVDYRRGENWLCRPGRRDVCAAELTMTSVAPDGTMRRVAAATARPQGVDCFYVYPTVSLDPGDNSDMLPGDGEQGMTTGQFAPFRSVCRPFAPLYRQVTLTALRKGLSSKRIPGDFALAYDDVKAAWRDYLAHDNGGRPFVLIGHSQGSALLKRLIADEIDGKPLQRRMLSAVIPGTAVIVPADRDVGGDFAAVPLCRAPGQIGCVVTWSSYRDTRPPPANGLFGKAAAPGMQAGCTNPARLGGGTATLDPVFGYPWWTGGVAHYRKPAAWPVPTRFLALPDALTGECVTRGNYTYLTVTVKPGSKRVAAIEAALGTAAIGDVAYPDWGFHVVDTPVVAGDLLRLVSMQAETWSGARTKK